MPHALPQARDESGTLHAAKAAQGRLVNEIAPSALSKTVVMSATPDIYCTGTNYSFDHLLTDMNWAHLSRFKSPWNTRIMGPQKPLSLRA